MALHFRIYRIIFFSETNIIFRVFRVIFRLFIKEYIHVRDKRRTRHTNTHNTYEYTALKLDIKLDTY